jgi:hypothetical protein
LNKTRFSPNRVRTIFLTVGKLRLRDFGDNVGNSTCVKITVIIKFIEYLPAKMMSSFELENENRAGDSNIPSKTLFFSPLKGASSDNFEREGLIHASGADHYIKMASPMPFDESIIHNNSVSNCVYSVNLNSTANESNVTEEVVEADQVPLECSADAELSRTESDQSTADNENQQETDAQRLEREERESQQLAWELMQQDNMEMYNMQLQFMQENAGELSEEDLALMQSLVAEAARPPAVALTRASAGREEGDEEEGEEEEGEGEGNLDDSDASNWDYDRLLQLGAEIGGKRS